MKKIVVIVTHPIQYYVPVFRLLAKKCELKVFYTWGEEGVGAKNDPGFGITIAWDLPLLDEYNYELLENTSTNPGSHHGKGIINPKIISKIQRAAPDAILIYGYIYESHFKVMRHFKGKIPIWFRGDSTLLDEHSGWKAIAKKIYLKWVYSHVDKAFYVGTNNKAYFKQYGLKESQLIFAPHAIDNRRFEVDHKTEANALRASLGIKDNDILVLFAGKLEAKKDPNLLLDAFLTLNKTNTHLLFMGNGVLEEQLKTKVEVTKLKMDSVIPEIERQKPNIHFMDFQNQSKMPIVYQACDLFCLPSKGPGETWGLAVNEAMATGKAILTSDKVGCAIDLVTAENGAIFKARSLEDLREKLAHLCQDQNQLANLGQSSKTKIHNWSFNIQTRAIIALLEKQ